MKHLLLLGLVLGALACAEVRYVGETHSPTTNIDIFYDENSIEREFTTIGHAIGTGGFGLSTDKIQKKLIEEAKKRGADAILIKGVGKDSVPFGDDSSTDETQINASFLKYKK